MKSVLRKAIRKMLLETAFSNAEFTFPDMEKARKDWMRDYHNSITPEMRNDLENNLVYVHWGFASNIYDVVKNQAKWSRNQLSASIYKPGQELKLPSALAGSASGRAIDEDPVIGVLMRPKRKGPNARMVVVAANADMYSGQVMGQTIDQGFPKKDFKSKKERSAAIQKYAQNLNGSASVLQRNSSSGLQKTPYHQDFTPYLQAPGQHSGWMDKLIKSSADFDESATTNEALIDNWMPVALVMPGETADNTKRDSDLLKKVWATSFTVKHDMFKQFLKDGIVNGHAELDTELFPKQQFDIIMQNRNFFTHCLDTVFGHKPILGWSPNRNPNIGAFKEWLLKKYDTSVFPAPASKYAKRKVPWKLLDAVHDKFAAATVQGNKIVINFDLDQHVMEYKDAGDY